MPSARPFRDDFDPDRLKTPFDRDRNKGAVFAPSASEGGIHIFKITIRTHDTEHVDGHLEKSGGMGMHDDSLLAVERARNSLLSCGMNGAPKSKMKGDPYKT